MTYPGRAQVANLPDALPLKVGAYHAAIARELDALDDGDH